MLVLYISVHAILEYDELRLFNAMGLRFFSIGDYFYPSAPSTNYRPGISGSEDTTDIAEQFVRLGCQLNGSSSKTIVTKEFVDLFDVIIVMNSFEFVDNNKDVIFRRPVIWRSVGQAFFHLEDRLRSFADKVHIVRCSPAEAEVPLSAGTDSIVRFAKFRHEWSGWRGNERSITTLYSEMKKRSHISNFEFYDACTAPFRRRLYGYRNEDIGWAYGAVSTDVAMDAIRASRVYFCAHSSPASYTLNFVEAWMTGAPVVAYGLSVVSCPEGYDVVNMIEHGVNGFIVDRAEEAHEICNELMENKSLADRISAAGRIAAIKYFDASVVGPTWSNVFQKLGFSV